MAKDTKQLSVRIPKEIHEWLEGYLQKFSYGETFSEKFNNMFLEMQRLDGQGVTFVNLEQLQKTKAEAEAAKDLAEFGPFREGDICVRYPHTFKDNKPEMKLAMCRRCKVAAPTEFKACRELRAEKQKEDEKHE